MYGLIPSLENARVSTWVITGLGLVVAYKWCSRPKLDHIPVVGHTGLLSYIDGYRFLWQAKSVLERGYDMFKTRGGAFKVPFPTHWFVILCSTELINEMGATNEQDFSFHLAVAELLQAKYTTGEDFATGEYHSHHVDAVRSSLTKNLHAKFEDVYDEMVHSFEELIPCTNDHEWVIVPAASTMQRIMFRMSNRIYLGLPICRDPEWMDLNIQYTNGSMMSAAIINLLPSFLIPIVGHCLSPLRWAKKVGKSLLSAEISHRLRMEREFGNNYDGRPNDLISWLLDHGPERNTVDEMVLRLLIINMGSIHSPPNSITQALFDLAAHPEYVHPMREEVIGILREEGWGKNAIDKMYKLDSFLRESARMNIFGAVTVNRRVVNLAGYTFANGLHLPYGTFVGTATYPIHHDPEIYEDPHMFKGFRFLNTGGDQNDAKHRMLNTNSSAYLIFGLGKRACPGRFFAVTQLKAMLAYVLITYEVRLDGDTRPANQWISVNVQAHPDAKLLFRRLKA